MLFGSRCPFQKGNLFLFFDNIHINRNFFGRQFLDPILLVVMPLLNFTPF